MIRSRDIEKKFGVSHGTAVKIMEYAVEISGDPTEDYWRDLAERAGPHFPRAKGLQNYLAEVRNAKRKSGGSGTKSKGAKSGGKKGKQQKRGGKNSSGQSKGNPQNKKKQKKSAEDTNIEEVALLDPNDDTAYFVEAAHTLRRLTVLTGRWLETLISNEDGENGEGYMQVLQVSEKLQKLQAELRQTETKLLEIRKERAELWSRNDVLASVGEVWVVCRGAMDKIVGRLVDLENLPAWLHEVGGYLPETREARQKLSDKVREMITRDQNALKESLESCATPSEDFSTEVRDECREEMAQELEKIAERLRNNAS